MQYEKEQLLSITRAGKVCALCGQPLDAQKHLSMLAPPEMSPTLQSVPEKQKSPSPADEAQTDPAPPATEAASAPGSDEQRSTAADKDNEPLLVRTDYHQECWLKVSKSDYLSFWLARRPKPPETPKMSKKERNVALLGLFSALMKSQDPIDDPAKFVLSHLLMKYRALKLGRSRMDERGRKWIVFHLPQTDEEYEILDVQLSDEQVAQTLTRITEYLETIQSDTTISPGESDRESSPGKE